MKKEKRKFLSSIASYVMAFICITSWVALGVVFALTSVNIGINGNVSVADESAYTTISFSYDDSAKTATVSDATTRQRGSLVIPSKVMHNGAEYNVTSIGDAAFSGCSLLTSITIPTSVTSIGSEAFRRCLKLTSIQIPEGVTEIGIRAFYSCSALTSITIPDGVTSIGESTFQGCSALTSITIPEGVTSIGDAAFSSCSALTSITIPDGVTSIGMSVFTDCSALTSITIPDGVTEIGSHAFENCSSLTSITIPENVTSIGDYTFQGCSALTSATFEKTTNWKAGNTTLSSSDLANKATAATYLTSKYVSSIWTRVADESEYTTISFSYDDSAKTATVSEVKAKPNDALVIVIPSSVLHNGEEYTIVTIEDFMDCQLTSVSIPANVTSIGDYAFGECSALTSVTFENTTGWEVDGEALNSSDLANKSTAATFLTSTYRDYIWTRS